MNGRDRTGEEERMRKRVRVRRLRREREPFGFLSLLILGGELTGVSALR